MSKNATAVAVETEAEKALPSLQYLPLSVLRPGHEAPSGSIDSRKYGRGEAADLIPSLRAFGVVVPMVIKTIDGKHYVCAGNRRLAGMCEIVPPANRALTMIPTVELGHGDALEISMMENSQRMDLHPVDRFEVFEILVKAGATVDDIARRYLMKPGQVRQALSLAQLAPEVREAWRADKIGGETAEAFAATSDHAAQVKVLKKLGKNGVGKWQVERELGVNERDANRLLKFVGRKAYEDRGHFLNETLFSERDGDISVSDLGALKVMSTEKLDAEIDGLLKEGWGWVIPEVKKPGDLHAWKRVYPGGNGKFPKDVMAAAGCVVGISWEGKLEVHKGYVKPGSKVALPKGATQTTEQKKAAAKKKKERAENGPAVTNALAGRLSQQITLAAEDVLREHHGLALRVAVAALACAENPTNIKLPTWSLGQDEWRKVENRDEKEFDKYLKLIIGKTDAEVLQLLAFWVGQAVDLTAFNAQGLPLCGERECAAALLRAMPPKAITKGLRLHFKPDDYFDSMAADAARAALKEMGLPEPKVGKKSGLSKTAATAAKSKGWLPPEMRVPGAYDGPAAKAAAKRKARK